jgi:hypothetical protein
MFRFYFSPLPALVLSLIYLNMTSFQFPPFVLYNPQPLFCFIIIEAASWLQAQIQHVIIEIRYLPPFMNYTNVDLYYAAYAIFRLQHPLYFINVDPELFFPPDSLSDEDYDLDEPD